MRRVSSATAALDIDLRLLQRRFRHYVGVGPKWVIRRYRLHEAAEQLKAQKAPPLAGIAPNSVLHLALAASFGAYARRVRVAGA